jgi:hypothetical protein
LVILDEVYIDDISGTYDLIYRNDISAHHIKLSSVVQTSDYRTVSDSEKSTWGSKVKTFVQASQPTAESVGDLWFDSDDGYKAYRWNGASWVTVQDGEISELRTDIEAGNITLSSLTTINGEWYNESGVEIDATHGIQIYGTNNALRTAAYKDGPVQCYVGSDGAIYAGAGGVYMNASGLHIKGNYLFLKHTDGTQYGAIYGSSSFGCVVSAVTHANIRLSVSGTGFIYPTGKIDCDYDSSARLRLPVGTNQY